MAKAILYIHGKGGSKEEANRFKEVCKNYEVFGLNYKGNTPWDTKEEIIEEYQKIKEAYDDVYVIGNSIGAFFAMNALADVKVSKAFFISPIVNMERLILDMMATENVSESELKEKGIIPTKFGEDLSYEYLKYVRDNLIDWETDTYILYGSEDNLTSIETIREFVDSHNAKLTIMERGEHYFHTKEQLDFLDRWLLAIGFENEEN